MKEELVPKLQMDYKYVINEMSFGDKLRAIGADSTAVNTGKNGAIRLLECHLKRALQWFICSLHVNELPLRHLCKKTHWTYRIVISVKRSVR